MQQLSFKRIISCVGIGIVLWISGNVINNVFFSKPKVSDEVIVQKAGANLENNINKVMTDPAKASQEATVKKMQEYDKKVASGEIVKGKEYRDKGLVAEQKGDLSGAWSYYRDAGDVGYDKNTIEADKKRVMDKKQAIQNEWKRICSTQPPDAAKSFLEALDKEDSNATAALSLYYDAAKKGFDGEIVNKQIEKMRQIHRF